MTDNLLLGTKSFITSNYQKAITYFSNLLESRNDSDKTLGYLYRGTCFLELGDLDKAREDFEKGLTITKSSFELKYKLGLVLFKMRNFEEADKIFRAALISSSNSEEREKLLLWQNKTRLEIETIKENKNKKIANIKFSNNWFQTANTVIVTLDTNIMLNKNIVSVSIEKRSIFVLYEDVKVYEIILSNAVLPEKSTSKILTQKIELNLEKDNKGFDWITLDEKSKSEVQKYPTSMKKDFNAINKEIDSDLSKDKADPSGNDAMMTLFKEIYSNAGEDMKRAMMKSYATSGGTVLSTNWDEVKTKDYEGKDRPEAPQGQQWADKNKK